MSRHSQQSHQSQHPQHLPGTSSTANSSKSCKSNSSKSCKSNSSKSCQSSSSKSCQSSSSKSSSSKSSSSKSIKSSESSKSSKSKAQGNRCEQAPNPLVQLVADSNKLRARILDIIQNMWPTMDPQRQGMMDYTAGVVRKMNEEEWDDFEEPVFSISPCVLSLSLDTWYNF